MSLALEEIGDWILGIVALIWTIDCFVAFYLTLPNLKRSSFREYLSRWKPAWLIKLRAHAFRINFDLHRAGGLWLWAMLIIFAWSSVLFNLPGFYNRVTKFVADYEPPAWAQALPDVAPGNDASKPLEWEQAQAIGSELMAEQARAHGFAVEQPEALNFLRGKGLYEYNVRSSRDIGDKIGPRYDWTLIHFDAYTSELRMLEVPTGQLSGNTLTTWIAELHMANVFGLPYRIFACVLGLVITMLSVTGVYIWWTKHRARKFFASRRDKAAEAAPKAAASVGPLT